MFRALNKKEGFTLVELLIVVAIIGILAAIAIPQFAAYRAKAYCSAVKSDLANYAISEEAYFTDYDAYTNGTDNVADPGSIPGFKPTDRVYLVHGAANTSPSINGFSVTGTHQQCDANGDGTTDTYTWDSTNGGMQTHKAP